MLSEITKVGYARKVRTQGRAALSAPRIRDPALANSEAVLRPRLAPLTANIFLTNSSHS